MLIAVLGLLAFAAPAQAVEYLSGGDFEGGTPVIEMEEGKIVGEGIDHPSWLESDDQYTSPICSMTLGECKGPAAYGPRGGQAWALFGAFPGLEAHHQSISQTVTLPAVEGAALSFYVWVGEFKREASLSIIFDQEKVLLQKPDLPAPSGNPAYTLKAVPIAAGGQIPAGPHTVTLQYISDSVAPPEPAPMTILSVDDVSFTATPVPTVVTPTGPVVTPPDTKITKVQLYRAKAGKTGSAKRPAVLKATQGKSGKPAKAKFFFSGSGGAGGLTFECKLDDGAFRSCGSPIFYKRLKPGRHSFEVRAVDRAGNKDPIPASYQWKARTGKSGKTK
jgi:hypothetical protein